ncbi:hypothetical protein MMG00_00635 [Ignatzschineria rhizosphaerae]|uniref:Rad50/SbcC-type AAA domain-containing protein n=1 Tax=Ignatzschineria rhizosphaerae TaxID=2923279 RepID=A0ABY3X3E1_9GAMM|nr:hypothetical protein [Ignatzschineria rhizosphaerae]UNM96415.1 hypothetical protein MMG00_00635 [Ignatzschineria rhizosphaerae]
MDSKIKNKNLLEIFIYTGIYDDITEIEALKALQESVQKEKDKINFFKDIKKNHENLSDLDEQIIERYLKYFPGEKEEFSDHIARIPLLKRGLQAHEKIIHSILSAQENLKAAYQNYLKEQLEGEVPCPFCGIEKASLHILLGEYDKQYKYFKGLLGNEANELSQITKELREKLINPVYEEILKNIVAYDRKPKTLEVLKKRNINSEQWKLVQSLKEYLKNANVKYQKILLSKDADDTQLEVAPKKLELLEELLTSTKKTISHYLEYDEIVSSFGVLGFQYKDEDNSPKLVVDSEEITISHVEKDLAYLQFLELKINDDILLKKTNKLELLKSEIVKLDELKKKIDDIKTVYTIQIKQYERDIVTKITIPFYIYSAKVLQTRLEGNGVFLETAIDERSNAKNYIRFVASAKDDHDAWNTMSSGQLSGIVITFMLTMNKVFPSYFKTLMIDDPVQNMDEINMVSLLQLLRYEFEDYQLIMSTHDKKISSFFKYKYDVFERIVKTINIKKYRIDLSDNHS